MTQLTPEQVARIERHLAEVVMGWHIDGSRNYYSGWGREEKFEQYFDRWHPLSNPAHAAMVREKMQELGYTWLLRGLFKLCRGCFAPEGNVTGEWYESPIESEASGVAAFLATVGKLWPQNT